MKKKAGKKQVKRNYATWAVAGTAVCLAALTMQMPNGGGGLHQVAGRGEKFHTFEQWLENDCGVNMRNKVKIQQSGENEWGLFATAEINQGELLFQVPFHCLMIGSEEEKQAGSLAKTVADAVHHGRIRLQTPSVMLLSLSVLEKSHNASTSLRPYFDILPDTYATFPLTWSLDEVRDLLQETGLAKYLERAQGDLLNAYHSIAALLGTSFQQSYSFDDFMQAYLAVVSRNAGLMLHGKLDNLMIPLWDMMNHESDPDVRTIVSGEFLQVWSVKTIPSNKEISSSYGDKSNGQFLVNYGFVLSNNVHDDVMLDISALIPHLTAEEDSLFANRVERLGRRQRLPSVLHLTKNHASMPSKNAIWIASVLVAQTIDELHSAHEPTQQHRSRAMDFIRSACWNHSQSLRSLRARLVNEQKESVDAVVGKRRLAIALIESELSVCAEWE